MDSKLLVEDGEKVGKISIVDRDEYGNTETLAVVGQEIEAGGKNSSRPFILCFIGKAEPSQKPCLCPGNRHRQSGK